MRKLPVIAILMLTPSLTARAQYPVVAEPPSQLLIDLKKPKPDSVRLKVLETLGAFYLYKPGELKSDLDSADLFLEQAKTLSEKSGNSKILNNILYLKAEVLFERGELPKARVAYLDVINRCMQLNEKGEAAH